VAKAGGVMAKWLMNRATSRVSAALLRDFPELSDTLIDNALTVSKGGEGGRRREGPFPAPRGEAGGEYRIATG